MSWLLLATAAAMQVAAPNAPIGSRIPSPLSDEQPSDASRRDGFLVAQKLGGCAVKADPHASMAYVLAAPESDASKAPLKKLSGKLPDCLVAASAGLNLQGRVNMSVMPSLLRGTLSEALYRLQFPTAAAPAPGTPVNVTPIVPLAGSHPKNRNLAITYEFAECLTLSAPGAVRSIILSKIGSAEERSAYAALGPAMPRCVTLGTTLKTDRLSFRFMLSEALYRWSVAARHAQEPRAMVAGAANQTSRQGQ
jgi:hypothetical protein